MLLVPLLCLCGVVGYLVWPSAGAVEEIPRPGVMQVPQTGVEGAGEAGVPLMDFSGLTAQNSDIIAWLTVDGTDIDYPVVQTVDNQYYLDHDAKKNASYLGAIFMDFRSNRDFS
ncbi:MAG: class B sortase, partial [Propionibacteriaceae bacterium]|nr:class B sortase [Propionibacteriaceae bacterium]